MRGNRQSKKIIRTSAGLALAAIGAGVLTGCGAQAAKLSLEVDGSKTETVLVAEGEQVVEKYSSTTTNLDKAGISYEEAQLAMAKFQSDVAGIPGIRYNNTISDEEAMEYIYIDFKQLDDESVRKLVGQVAPEFAELSAGPAHLEDTIELMTRAGFIQE